MVMDHERDTELFVTSHGAPSGPRIAEHVDRLRAIAEGEAGTVLRDTAGDETEWREIFADPVAHLGTRGVALPDGVRVSLQDRPVLTPVFPTDGRWVEYEPRPLSHARLEAYCRSIGGQMVWQTSCKEVCVRWIEYWDCFRDPDTGDWICILIRNCVERGFECTGQWVCSSP